MRTLQERVQAGIAVLDELGPENWRELVDLNTLDMTSESMCILGQLYGEYTEGKYALSILAGSDYGFDDRELGYPELVAEWKRVLAA